MFSPKVKRAIFKLAISIFVPDKCTIYRQYIESRMMQHKMKRFARTVTPADYQEMKLLRITERMIEIQKLIDTLSEKGFSDETSMRKPNIHLSKIQKQLDSIENEILQLFRYME